MRLPEDIAAAPYGVVRSYVAAANFALLAGGSESHVDDIGREAAQRTWDTVAKAGWDESKHPRKPKGDSHGGEFAGEGLGDLKDARLRTQVRNGEISLNEALRVQAASRGPRGFTPPPAESDPPPGGQYYYHFTKPDNLASIAESGIRPSGGVTSITPHLAAARWWDEAAAGNNAHVRFARDLVRAIKVPGYSAREETAELSTRTVVSPAAIEVYHDGRWVKIRDLVKKAWDESEHPRVPRGSSEGGEFVSAQGIELRSRDVGATPSFDVVRGDEVLGRVYRYGGGEAYLSRIGEKIPRGWFAQLPRAGARSRTTFKRREDAIAWLLSRVSKWDESEHPRGKTTEESTPGSFAPADGGVDLERAARRGHIKLLDGKDVPQKLRRQLRIEGSGDLLPEHEVAVEEIGRAIQDVKKKLSGVPGLSDFIDANLRILPAAYEPSGAIMTMVTGPGKRPSEPFVAMLLNTKFRWQDEGEAISFAAIEADRAIKRGVPRDEALRQNYRVSAYHELGHLLDRLGNGIVTNTMIDSLLLSGIKTDDAQRWIAKNLSPYAASSPHEAGSEAFAMLMAGAKLPKELTPWKMIVTGKKR